MLRYAVERAVASKFAHDFIKVHRTLRVSAAMEAGISLHVWSILEIVALLDAAEKEAAWRGRRRE